MGRARILGNNCVLLLHSERAGVPISLGEIDSFKAKSNTTVIRSRPIGFIREGVTLDLRSWDLSFEGGKVDWSLAHFYWMQDTHLVNGFLQPKFYITQTITHYDGSIESYIFEDVTLFGFESSIDADNSDESIQGFSPFRRIGIIDSTYAGDPTNIMREIIFREELNRQKNTRIGDE